MYTSFSKSGIDPVKIAVIGAGNRARKYLEYAVMHPDELNIVAIVDPVEIRLDQLSDKFNIPSENRFHDYHDFFKANLDLEAVMICTPEDKHFEPAMMAIDKGYNILLEKPIAQTLEQCEAIANGARAKKLKVGVCHVLRFHPYFLKIKEIIDSGELGSVISINHTADINLDRVTHGFVRGSWSRAERTNPMLISKCSHDIDLALWMAGSKCKKVSSFGSLRWFKAEHKPKGAADRCIHCPDNIESKCPYSAIDLYKVRRDWIANFDVPEESTLDEVLDKELAQGPYGRCVFSCDNNVTDHQVVNLETENEVTVSFAINAFTLNDCRFTQVNLTHGEITGDEKRLVVRKFRERTTDTYDFSHVAHLPFHGGSDLKLVADFVKALRDHSHKMRTDIHDSLESHRVCYAAEDSRLNGTTIILK